MGGTKALRDSHVLSDPFSLSPYLPSFPPPIVLGSYVPIHAGFSRVRPGGRPFPQPSSFPSQTTKIMEGHSIQTATLAHAEQALANRRQFSSMRAFLVGLLSTMSVLLPLHAPAAGFPSLYGQPDLPAADLHYIQSVPGCPLIFHGLNPVGICNIGVYEGQLVLKLKDAVSGQFVCGVVCSPYNAVLLPTCRASPCAPTPTPMILLHPFHLICLTWIR